MILKYGGSLNVVHQWVQCQYPHLERYELRNSVPEDVNPYDCVPKIIYAIDETSKLVHIKGFWWSDERLCRSFPPVIKPRATVNKKPVAFFVIQDMNVQMHMKLQYNAEHPTFWVLFIIAHFEPQLVSKATLRNVFLQRIGETLQSGHSDDAIHEWLKSEGFKAWPRLDKCTIADLRRFPHEDLEPTLWYRCHLFDVPCDIADQLELYEGGYVHVPRKYMGHVIWLFLERALPDKPKKAHHHVVEYFIRQLKHLKAQETQKAMNDVDIEDFPPCLQSIIAAKAFPKDQDRTVLVRTLKKAGKPLSFVRDIFEAKQENAKLRWDYEAQYNYDYAPPRCEAVNCPLKHDKQACRTLYLSKYGDVKDKDKLLYGPITWFDWHQLRRSILSKVVE